MLLKREIWNHKYRWVVRDKGRIVTHAKYTKEFNKATASDLFNKNKSLNPNKKVQKLVNVSEQTVVDGMKNSIPRNQERYQYFVSGTFRGQPLEARSMLHDRDFPLSEAKEEARSNFFSRLSSEAGLEYEEDTGKEVFQTSRDITIDKQGVVFYRQIAKA